MPLSVTTFDEHDFRKVLGRFCTGVVVVSGCHQDRPTGFAAQSFTSVSLTPPLIAVCPAKTSNSWPGIRASGTFCINILGSNQKALCGRFAKSGKDGQDKFANVAWTRGANGSPILTDAIGFIECTLVAEHEAGDHTIAVGAVTHLGMVPLAENPLLFFGGGYGGFAGLTCK